MHKDGMIETKRGGDSDCLSPTSILPTARNSFGTHLQCNGTGNVSSSRQKAIQAVEYYNSNIGKARCSYNDRHNRHLSPTKSFHRQLTSQDALHRSNSSLELMHDFHTHAETALRREYGSHGSIDIIGNGESFFAMLQDYRPVVLAADQRSPGPAEFLKHKVDPAPSSENAVNSLTDETDGGRAHGNTSPKLKIKLHKFWGRDGNKMLRNGEDKTEVVNQNYDTEERQRRRIFAHYDCQSLTANLGYAAKLRGLLLARRRNTTTGASAASMLGTRSATPDGDSGDEDSGDGTSNELVESCPYFRNEIGGEEERMVSLTRLHTHHAMVHRERRKPFHRPSLSCGVSILEFPPGETHWKNGTCPYQPQVTNIENIDHGALYYRKYFYGQDHQNWFGLDENLGPVAISIKREKISKNPTGNVDCNGHSNSSHQYRLVIRTSELLTLRGSVFEESIPNLKSSSNLKTYNTKEVLEYITPEITLSSLRLGVHSNQTEEQLLKLDEQGLSTNFKVGIMYCQAGQSSEEDMYNNEEAGPAFLEFLDTIGQRVRLKGFDKYRAGLDNKTDSTGLYSVFARYEDCEIMFHVSTLLPFTANNRQQLLRKRHIGNDIVTIVFQEPGAQPFTPKSIRSQFQHVFVVVRAINPCTDDTQYSVAVSRSREVPVFGPPIHQGATFPKGKAFADFLLAKIINAEIAAHSSEKFSTMATRTRQEYLKDLATNYVTSTVVETIQKFSMLSFSSKKKERVKPKFHFDVNQRGAICWQVVLEDSGQSQLVDCFLGISTDSFVLVEERSREIVMVTPCQAILGWFIHSNSLCIYHHQGECTTIHMREGGDRDELMEVLLRLRSVSPGCVAQEFSLKRNSMGQLGFHVQPDGIVTQVESNGLAWSAGLRQGARLVEICKVAVSTLTHDQMVDLLKTSASVMVTVIPPHSDGNPRRGCNLHNCKYTLSNYEGDYENIQCNNDNSKVSNRKAASLQQAGNHKKRYERSFSPPRSSNSSGYGTGSSSKSFNDEAKFSQTSTTRLPAGDGHWYEESLDVDSQMRESPPPLPARLQSQLAKQRKENGEVLMMAKKWEDKSLRDGDKIQKIWTPQAKKWPVEIENAHTKIQTSHSLPPNHGGFSLPAGTANSSTGRFCHSDNPPNNIPMHDFKVGDKVTCLKVNHINRIPKMPDSLPADCILSRTDAPSTDNSSVASEKLVSEDELSASSGNASPRTIRLKHPHVTMTNSNNSRNQSPRPASKDGEVRLRPGVTARPVPSNRNSANLTGSTLQEDLIKLINVDYQSDRDEGQMKQNINRVGNVENGPSSKLHGSSGSGCPSVASTSSETSRNTINVLSGDVKKRDEREGNSEVILTTARPATVISNASTASSPAPSEIKLSKEERLSPRVTKSPQYPNSRVQQAQKQQLKTSTSDKLPIPVPDPGEMDWSSLVDTATRAMLNETSNNTDNLTNWIEGEQLEHLSLDSASASGTRRLTDLQNNVTQLETRLARETRRRMSLEDEVRRLREENRRLQEESQAAAQQLRRFTEWFFQTIDKQ
ncbi:hypothetical protein RUM44_011863 [Polyplax serrata]|uniref:Signal-induced proliferation-associated 1-like protein 2 n=1 Tax=Polyplax serrata TaxID=468196 RepID=A0ABR1BA09_POLSC